MRTLPFCLTMLILGACASPDSSKDSAEVLTIGDSVATNAEKGTWIWHEIRAVKDTTGHWHSILLMRRSAGNLASSPSSGSHPGVARQAQALLSLRELESLVHFAKHAEPTSANDVDAPRTLWKSRDLTVALYQGEDGVFLSPWFGSEYFHRHLSRDEFLEMATKTFEAAGLGEEPVRHPRP